MAAFINNKERELLERKTERKKTFKELTGHYLKSFVLGVKIAGITMAVVILIYLLLKFLGDWDLFYETDVDYLSLFFAMGIFFGGIVIICLLVAFWLFNNKHKRNTKY